MLCKFTDLEDKYYPTILYFVEFIAYNDVNYLQPCRTFFLYITHVHSTAFHLDVHRMLFKK